MINELTPNIRKLIFHKMSVDAIPPGGGIASGIKFLSDKNNISRGLHSAKNWAEAAILSVRNAPGPNPWKNSSDEDIAAEIMKKVEEKKSGHKPQTTDR